MKQFIALFVSIAVIWFSSSVHAAAVTRQFYIKQQSVMSVTTTSAQFLPDNINRVYLLIQNRGTDTIFVKVGSTISGGEGIALGVGSSYEFSVGPTSSIWMKSNSGTQSVVVIEGNAQ